MKNQKNFITKKALSMFVTDLKQEVNNKYGCYLAEWDDWEKLKLLVKHQCEVHDDVIFFTKLPNSLIERWLGETHMEYYSELFDTNTRLAFFGLAKNEKLNELLDVNILTKEEEKLFASYSSNANYNLEL